MTLLEKVLQSFGIRAREILPPPQPGFSNASVLQIVADNGAKFCLRQSAVTDTTDKQLRWAFQILNQASQSGCHFIPVPKLSQNGVPWVTHESLRWELTPWMSGTADLNERPDSKRLAASISGILRFQQTTAAGNTRTAISPGVERRLEMLLALPNRLARIDNFRKNESALAQGTATMALKSITERHSALFTQGLIFGNLPQRLQPIHGDLWHDHLLFESANLSGLIDFAAMQIDTPLIDWGRLISSLRFENQIPWQIAIETLSRLRGYDCSLEEIELLRWLGQITLIFAAVHWIERLFVEPQTISNEQRARERFSNVCHQLELEFQN
ncbi:MAG: aminoglycoside phosphotransferase family protein [Pirellulaceae bacterium]|nr:aminoglycoside phosphotransferase family protein [Pirellulaceae bacterium]